MNFIFLFLFTLCEGFLIGTAASTYQADSVIIAVVITTVVCLAITMFSFQTKIDVTGMGGYLLVAAVVFMLFGLFAIFLPRSQFPIVSLVYACFGALLFSFYLLFDTQLLIGGKHKFAISPEEYIFAALSIYLDIINIFIFILQIVDSARN
jgi:FtsH-binding integral membrane protein